MFCRETSVSLVVTRGLDFMKETYGYDLDASVKCSNFICLYRLSAPKNPDMGAGKASVDLLDSLCNCMGLCFPYGRD